MLPGLRHDVLRRLRKTGPPKALTQETRTPARVVRVAFISSDSGIRTELVHTLQTNGMVLIYVEPSVASLTRLRAEEIACVLTSSEHLFAVAAVLKAFAPIISFSTGDDPDEICEIVRATTGALD